MAYGVVRLDRVSGTFDGSKLKSAKYFSGASTAAIDNGNFVHINDELVANNIGGTNVTQREVFKVVTPTSSDTRATVGLVASVEIDPTYPLKHMDLANFTNAAGSVIRVYSLEPEDIFSVTGDALSGSPAKGAYVHIANGATKLAANSTATDAFGVILDVDVVGSKTYYVIKVK